MDLAVRHLGTRQLRRQPKERRNSTASGKHLTMTPTTALGKVMQKITKQKKLKRRKE